ncbi:MAG: hypothetical protein ACQXXJ_08785 [Candidatus Bathyarchaeia archaeon]|jgi:hypothetical protein
MNNEIQEKPENLDELMKKLIPDITKKPAYIIWNPYDEYISKILFAFIVYGEMNLYQIHKVTGLAHATAHKKIKEAKEEGLITVKSISKFRTGLSSKTYDLTPYGFQFIIDRIERKALLEYPQLLQQLEKRARENPQLDPALEWWDVFMKEDRLLQLFYLEEFSSFEEEFPDFIIMELFEPEPFEIEHRNTTISRIVFADAYQKQLEEEKKKEQRKSKLFSLLQKNEKLKTVVLERLRYLQEYYKSWIKGYEKLEQKLRNQCV